MKHRTLLSLALSLCVCVCVNVIADDMPTLQQGNARVIFVGDSITGQSRNANSGYAHQFEAAVKAIYPDSTPQIISLGGSGHSVGSWIGIEKKSRDKSVVLDIKTRDVHEELAKHAHVLIIMLGMNDVLAPYVTDTPQSLDKWAAGYQSLIDALKIRVTPGVLALAGITPCTEDPDSPKNQLIGKLNQRVQDLAAQNQARFLPTSETLWAIQREGRKLDHNFHVTADFVHPTAAGHIGIAMGMLKGLGENELANWLKDNRLKEQYDKITARKAPFAWDIQAVSDWANLDKTTYTITYNWLNPTGKKNVTPNIKLNAPEGWQVSPTTLDAINGTFTVIGTPNHHQNLLTLHATAKDINTQAQLQIPAPWLVGVSLTQRLWKHPGYDFQADKARTPVDDVIEAEADFTKPIDLGQGNTLRFKPYHPSVNFTGKDDPDSVDFSAIIHATNFEAGYITRWIYSDKQRTCTLTPKTRMFAGYMYLNIWVNGKTVYTGRLRKAPVTEIQLQKGWNTLVCRSSHHNWQWQLTLPINGQNGDDLSDLRYSIVQKLKD